MADLELDIDSILTRLLEGIVIIAFLLCGDGYSVCCDCTCRNFSKSRTGNGFKNPFAFCEPGSVFTHHWICLWPLAVHVLSVQCCVNERGFAVIFKLQRLDL